jgi:hypothetical protein
MGSLRGDPIVARTCLVIRCLSGCEAGDFQHERGTLRCPIKFRRPAFADSIAKEEPNANRKQMYAKHADAHRLNGYQGVSSTVALLRASSPRFGMPLNFNRPRLDVKHVANDP